VPVNACVQVAHTLMHWLLEQPIWIDEADPELLWRERERIDLFAGNHVQNVAAGVPPLNVVIAAMHTDLVLVRYLEQHVTSDE
jgi:hypothetical protein